MASNPEMPCYVCHKKVRALKIARMDQTSGSAKKLTPTDPNFPPFTVDRHFVNRHKPQPGGYFVVYKDGYQSFSPAQAFEDGYTLCTDDCEGSDPKDSSFTQPGPHNIKGPGDEGKASRMEPPTFPGDGQIDLVGL